MTSPLAMVVTGLPRSGTTIIGRTLLSHPHLWSGFECGLLLEDFPDRVHAQWLCEGRWHWGLTAAQRDAVLRADRIDDAYALLLKYGGTQQRNTAFHCVYDNFRAAQGLVDKTPQYVFDLQRIMKKTRAPVVLVYKPFAAYSQSLKQRGHEWKEAWTFWNRMLQQLAPVLEAPALRKRLRLLNLADYLAAPEPFNAALLALLVEHQPTLAADVPLLLSAYAEKTSTAPGQSAVGDYRFETLKPLPKTPDVHDEFADHTHEIARQNAWLDDKAWRPST